MEATHQTQILETLPASRLHPVLGVLSVPQLGGNEHVLPVVGRGEDSSTGLPLDKLVFPDQVGEDDPHLLLISIAVGAVDVAEARPTQVSPPD